MHFFAKAISKLVTDTKEENVLESVKRKLVNEKNTLKQKAAFIIAICHPGININIDELRALIHTHISSAGPCLLKFALSQDKPDIAAIHFILKHNLGSNLQRFFSKAVKVLWKKANSQAEKLLFLDILEILLVHLFVNNKTVDMQILVKLEAKISILSLYDQYQRNQTIGATIYDFYKWNEEIFKLNPLISICKKIEQKAEQSSSRFNSEEIAEIKRMAWLRAADRANEDFVTRLWCFCHLNNSLEVWNRIGTMPCLPIFYLESYYKPPCNNITDLYCSIEGIRDLLKGHLNSLKNIVMIDISKQTDFKTNKEVFTDNATQFSGKGFMAAMCTYCDFYPSAQNAPFSLSKEISVMPKKLFVLPLLSQLWEELQEHIEVTVLAEIIMNYIFTIVGMVRSDNKTYFFVSNEEEKSDPLEEGLAALIQNETSSLRLRM